jgi:hypothetical protein
VIFAPGNFAHPGRTQPARQRRRTGKVSIREKILDLADKLMEVLDGEDVSIGASALLTALLEMLADASLTKEELVQALAQIREGIIPHAVALWESNQPTSH